MDSKLAPLKYKLSKIFRTHQTFVVLLVFLLVLVAAIFRIHNLSNLPVDQSYIDLKKSEIKTVRFNEQAIEEIEELNESNVSVPGTNLPQNRQNPFNE